VHCVDVLTLRIRHSWGLGFSRNFLRICWGSDFGFSLCAAPYLLTLSKYFKWGQTLEVGIKSETNHHRGEHRRVMKVEVQSLELAIRFDSQDNKVMFSSIKVFKSIFKMIHNTHG